MNSEQIQVLGGKATTVAAQAVAMDDAYSEELGAEAALLEAAIAAARPALRALSSRVRRVYWTRIDQHSALAEEHTEHFPADVRGFRIAGEGPKKERGNDSGAWSGSALYLLEDGRLATVDYSGKWTAWVGSRSGWEATMKLQTPLEAMENWSIDDALAGISRALDDQLKGNAGKRTKAALERAEKLRALLALVK